MWAREGRGLLRKFYRGYGYVGRLTLGRVSLSTVIPEVSHSTATCGRLQHVPRET